jgi:hypothetical protein
VPCLEGRVLYRLLFCANSELWRLVAAGLEGPINPDLIIENYGEMVTEVAGSLVVAKYSEPGLLKTCSQEANLESNLLDVISPNRLLTKSASGVLAALRGSTYGREYDSPLRLLRPCWPAFLNSLQGFLEKSVTSKHSCFRCAQVVCQQPANQGQ